MNIYDASTDEEEFEWQPPHNEEEETQSDEEIARALQLLEEGKAAAKDDEEIIPFEKGFEICCIKCICQKCNDNKDDQERKLEVLPSGKSWVVRIHRKCCTTIKKIDESDPEYVSTSYGFAVANSARKKKKVDPSSNITFVDLRNAKKKADQLREKVLGDQSYQDPVSHRHTDERYSEIVTNFDKVKAKAKQPRDGINILSLFSGVGGDLLVIKRLGIKVCNYVCVEHDPFANAVCRANHKNDVDSYHHVTTFEEFEKNDIEELMVLKGPFHLVTGGPPCSEYSAVNANREGVHSEKGSYMLRFGQIVNRVKHFNVENGVHGPFFLCENVPTKWDDQRFIEMEFGISPVVIDAVQMTPAKRNRVYYTNLPINELPSPDSKESLSSICLTGGWLSLSQMHCHLRNKPMPYSKAMTFMASEGRLDDKRMLKVKVDNESCCKPPLVVDFYSVADREMLLGYPIGYVQSTVFDIFEKLETLFQSAEWVEEAIENNWNLDELMEFSGGSYRFELVDGKLALKVGTVDQNREGKPLYYLNAQQYCKRLLGNGFSIPVVEHLLCPLKGLFLEKTYKDALYQFAWE